MQRLSLLGELGKSRWCSSKDLDLYVKKFYEEELDCCDPVDEEVLVNVCLHGMVDEYPVHVEYVSFPFFPGWLKLLDKPMSL